MSDTARSSRCALPALDGRDPLGFLAAVGLLRVLRHHGLHARLAWHPTTSMAELSGAGGVDDVVEALISAVEALPPDGLMVGLPPDVPPRKRGSRGQDPARLGHDEFRDLVDRLAGDPESRAWARALWTDLGSDRSGACARTPFSAPSGQMTMRSMFEKPAALVRREPAVLLREAVTGWRRRPKFTGENLDIRALRLAAEQPDGEATTFGVPGATWLALAAIPSFPMGGDGRRARTVAWPWLAASGSRVARPAFRWPLWRRPLDVLAAELVIAHEVVDRAAQLALDPSPDGEAGLRAELDALGIDRVLVARRRQMPGGQSAGVLVPVAAWA